MNETIKGLGRKARERLEQERKRRREIVRLGVEELPPTTTETMIDATQTHFSTTRVTNRSKQSGPLVATGLDRKAPKKRKKIPRLGVGDKKETRASPCTPDVAGLIHRCSHLPQSRFIQLHGVPGGCCPQQLRRFLSGLPIMRFYVIPNVPKRKILRSYLDCEYNEEEDEENEFGMDDDDHHHHGLQLVQQSFAGNQHRQQLSLSELSSSPVRYQSSKHLSLWAEFPTRTMATLALQRSGEMLSFDKTRHDNNDTIRGSLVPKSFAIAVTVVPQPVLVALQPLTIQLSLGDTAPFHETLQGVQGQVHPCVLSVLWNEAQEQLNQRILGRYQPPLSIPLYRDNDEGVEGDNVRQYQHLQQRIKDMGLLLQQLYRGVPFDLCNPYDPSLLENPVIRWSSLASTVLHRERQRCREYENLYHRWKNLSCGQVKSPPKTIERNSDVQEST